MSRIWLLTDAKTYDWLLTFEQTARSARIWVIRCSTVLNLICCLFKANNTTSRCHYFLPFQAKRSSCCGKWTSALCWKEIAPASLLVLWWWSDPQSLTCVCQCERLQGPCLGESITGCKAYRHTVVVMEERVNANMLLEPFWYFLFDFKKQNCKNFLSRPSF